MRPKHILFFTLFWTASAQFYEDQRCRCICPSASSVFNNSEIQSDRKLYIALVPPSKCNCDDVILPHVSEEVLLNAQVFCLRCECRYESRNTTIIMVVVIIILWILMLLTAYLIFLALLGPLVKKRRFNVYININTDEARRPLMEENEEFLLT